MLRKYLFSLDTGISNAWIRQAIYWSVFSIQQRFTHHLIEGSQGFCCTITNAQQASRTEAQVQPSAY
jgi:hypothetical protein